jgi:hypothetical protein
MRKINLLIFVLIFAASALAQTNQSASLIKIALIGSESFYDGKTGIKRLAYEERQLGMTDCAAIFRYSSLLREIQKTEKEIGALNDEKKPVIDKLIRLQTLKDESKKALDENVVCKANLRFIRVQPIVNDVRKKLKEFAESKGYAVVIDRSSSDIILIDGEMEEVTAEFIEFCNESFKKEKLQ